MSDDERRNEIRAARTIVATRRPMTPRIAYYRHLGVEVYAAENGAVVTLPFRPELGNSRQHVHGGATASIADITLAQTAKVCSGEGTQLATIDMQIAYLEAGCGDLLALGRIVRMGGSIAVAEADVVDSRDVLVARATGALRVFK